MPRLRIQPNNQVKRIETIQNRLSELMDRSEEKLAKRPKPKKWSVVEIIEHLNLSHQQYRDRIKNSLDLLIENDSKLIELKARYFPSAIIKRLAPKESHVRFKVKTFNKFKPVLDEIPTKQKIHEIFTVFDKALSELKEWVISYSLKKHPHKIKFTSPTSKLVKLNVPEACEFLLVHIERHFVQINEGLNSD